MKAGRHVTITDEVQKISAEGDKKSLPNHKGEQGATNRTLSRGAFSISQWLFC